MSHEAVLWLDDNFPQLTYATYAKILAVGGGVSSISDIMSGHGRRRMSNTSPFVHYPRIIHLLETRPMTGTEIAHSLGMQSLSYGCVSLLKERVHHVTTGHGRLFWTDGRRLEAYKRLRSWGLPAGETRRLTGVKE